MLPPKRPNDHVCVARAPVETRPLKCKNHDSTIKLVKETIFSRCIKKHACDIQHGFIPGRNFVCNVVCIDAFARLVSFSYNWALLPLLDLFDLKAASPSVAHDWLFLVLRKSGAPPPL